MHSSFDTIPAQPPRALHRYRGWAALRSMRTALLLLAALALASALAGLVPQRPNVPEASERFLGTAPWLRRAVSALGLFDVFGSWWFQGVLVALLAVLVACLVPRTAALVRQRRALIRAPRVGPFPRTGRHTTMETPATPAEVLGMVRGIFRRRAYRVSETNEAGQLIAERGFAREAGSLLFHWSMLVLILGAAISQGFGFKGQAIIVEGERWADDAANYSFYAPGRFFRESGHGGFVLELLSFQVSYRPEDGTPSDFVSRVKVFERGREVKDELIRVNDPLVHGGTKFYQASYGWAPVVRVSAAGTVLHEAPVVSFPGGPGGSVEGVIRLPSREPGVALLVDLYPDPVFAPSGVPGLPPPVSGESDTRPVNLSDVPGGSSGRTFGNTRALGIPIVVVRAFQGDLRADRPQNVYSLDVTGLEPSGGDLLVLPDAEAATAGALSSRSVDLAGVTVELLGLRRFTVLSVKKDPGVPVVGLAAVMILAGLLPSLVAWRRRFWVHVIERDGEPTLVEFGGVAYQRKERFDDEFTALALRLRNELPPVLPVPERAPIP